VKVRNQLAILALSAGLFAGCISAPSQSQARDAGRDLDNALYLHLLVPPIKGQTPARRIVTARVYLSREIAVSVGDTEDPFTKGWDGAWTHPLFDTNGVAQVRPLEAVWNSGDAVLAGRIERRDGKFLAHLQGRNQTTLNYFHGEIELEKPVYEQGGSYRGGAIWGVWFALSESPDCQDFLKRLDDGTLQYPLVDRDSPEAKQWEGK
jgi:hypothetical protein